MEFVKLHGAGNDFLCLDARGREGWDWPALGRAWCDRHFGVGGDGLLLLLDSEVADWRLRIINSDGSEAEMCGNGIRCFVKWLRDEGFDAREQLAIETPAGIMRPRLVGEPNGATQQVIVDMGPPGLDPAQVPFRAAEGVTRVAETWLEAEGRRWAVTPVSMGNPHAVIFVDDLEAVDVEGWGPGLETHAAFPAKTNVEFVRVDGPGELTMRVWERGAGRTLACGTGACATVVAGVLSGRCERRATVHLDGGDLEIEWSESDDRLWMTGPATTVFRGRIG